MPVDNIITKTIWFAVNKNGFVGLYLDKPVRNKLTKKWESKYPFINSIIYNEIVDLVEKAKYTWENEPECITITNAKT